MPKSSQLGYNHNIPHRGRLFHVQTEDSGREKAHIYTHVFHAGSIIATNKVVYDLASDGEDFDTYVIGLMQESHKALIRQLRAGALDERIVMLLGPHPQSGGSDETVATASASSSTSTAGHAEERAKHEKPPAESEGRASVTPSVPVQATPAHVAAALASPASAEFVPPPPRPRSLSELGLPPPLPVAFEPALAHPAIVRIDPDRVADLQDLGPAAPAKVPRRPSRKSPLPSNVHGAAGNGDFATVLPLRDVLLGTRSRDETMDALDTEILRHVNAHRRTSSMQIR